MRICFKHPSPFNHLCLMERNTQSPLILTRQSIKDLQGFFGKFVFCKQSGRLALDLDTVKHRKIAKAAFKSFSKTHVVGAFLEIDKFEDGRICFVLSGKSGYFDNASINDLKIVAQHIASLLNSFVIEEQDNKIIVKGAIDL